MSDRGWARRVWAAWVSGTAPKEVGEGITSPHAGVRAVRRFVEEWDACGVCLVEGDYGAGKSHLLRMGTELAKREGRDAVYVTWETGGFRRVGDLVVRIFGEAGVRLGWDVWQGAEAWFKMARTVKERWPESFSPKERKFIYHLGVYTANGWEPSEAQRRWGGVIIGEAVARGASRELAEAMWSVAEERFGGPLLCAVDEAEAVLEGGDRVKEGFVALLKQVMAGDAPLRMLVAVTPELRRVLESDCGGGEGIEVIRVPALGFEEAAKLAEIVLDVFEMARGRSCQITTGAVRELLRRHPSRREFVQGVARYVESVAGG